jgi:hypothetical protein
MEATMDKTIFFFVQKSNQGEDGAFLTEHGDLMLHHALVYAIGSPDREYNVYPSRVTWRGAPVMFTSLSFPDYSVTDDDGEPLIRHYPIIWFLRGNMWYGWVCHRDNPYHFLQVIHPHKQDFVQPYPTDIELDDYWQY